MKVTIQKGRCVHHDGEIYLQGKSLDVSQKDGERLKTKGAVITVEEEISQDAILEAAKKAIEAGEVIGSGKPKVEAMEEILGKNISAKERDYAYEQLKAEDAAGRE